jgi:hypothetical protein
VNRISFYSRETTAYDYLQARAPRHLWAAVLEQAIRDVVEGPSQSECRFMDLGEAQRFCLAVRVAAEEWIADEENEPRRFCWVCEQLGVEPSAVRARIARRRAA